MVHTDTLDGSLMLEQTANGLIVWANTGDTDITLMSEGREMPPGDQVQEA